MKNNKQEKFKNKKLIISSLSLFGVSAVVASTALISTSQSSIEQDSSLNNRSRQTSSRQTSSNTVNRNNVINPDEVFFVSQDLSLKDPWDPNTNSIVQENADLFVKLGQNLANVKGFETDDLKALKNIAKDVASYVKYRQFEQNYKQTGLGDKPIEEGGIPWESIKDHVLTLFEARETFDQIDNITNIRQLLENISGIVNDTSLIIKTISNKPSKSFQIDATNGMPEETLSNISAVAGKGYETLVKIAELNLSDNKTFVLDFEYQASASSQGALGKLIIKNDHGQIKNAANLAEAYNNLDIFGRYYNMTGQIGFGSYKKDLSNFVLKRDGDTLSIMVRVSQNEKINNIKFSTEDTLYGQPTMFGILDVQASDTRTYLDYLNNDNSIGKLILDPTVPDVNQLNKIQFYSDRITVKYDPEKPNISDLNRTIEFYQGKDQEVKFGLNYITTITDNSNDYEKIVLYNAAGQPTTEQQMITFTYDGTQPSIINPPSIDFHADLQNKLPEEIKAIPLNQISRINFTSMASGNLAKQTLNFAQGFYLIGNSLQPSVSSINDYEISLRDITEKVFYEKPDLFVETQNINNTHSQVLVKTDTKTNVVRALGSLYEAWYNNQGKFADLYNGSFDVEYITFDGKNVNIEIKTIGKTGSEIIKGGNGIDTYWKQVSTKIRELYNKDYPEANDSRFTVQNVNTGENIVNLFLLGNIEYITNLNEVQNALQEVIAAWNEDSANKNPQIDSNGQPIVPTFDKLSRKTQEIFANNLAKLIEIQYDAILNEFKTNQLLPFYDGLLGQISSTDVLEGVYVVNDPAQFLQFIDETEKNPRLIKYQPEGYNKIYQTTSSTLKNQLVSLIKLLSFGTESGGIGLIDSIICQPLLNEKFKSYESPEQMLSFNQQKDYSYRLSQLQIIQAIINYFNYSFEVEGTENLVFKKNNGTIEKDFKVVIDNIIKSLNEQTSEYKPTTSGSYSSYWLDNIIAGSNVVSSMLWKLKAIGLNSNNNSGVYGVQQATRQLKENVSLSDVEALKQRINWILSYNQASQDELASWNNINLGGSNYDFNLFAQNFSGRNSNDEDMIKTFEKITLDESIMAKRVIEFDKGSGLEITKTLKYIWPVVVGLIGLGIISASTYGIASRWKQVRTSTHPFIKWALFSLVIIGIGLVVSVILFGILPLF